MFTFPHQYSIVNALRSPLHDYMRAQEALRQAIQTFSAFEQLYQLNAQSGALSKLITLPTLELSPFWSTLDLSEVWDYEESGSEPDHNANTQACLFG